jgi:hypothetical protein
MTVIASVGSTPNPFSKRSHLPALRRSAAVAAVGLTVWLAAVSSASVHPKNDPPALQIKAPEWTRRRSIEIDPPDPERRRAPYSCSIG